MNPINPDIFKIESNHEMPSQGKILISEPFLCDDIFGRSVVLLVDHNNEGSMGLVLNKPHNFLMNELVPEFRYLDDIPLYKGGPVGDDTLFFLHNLPDVPGALAIDSNLYLNGDFDHIKRFVLQNSDFQSRIRFFVGYSGWEDNQLKQEIEENTWIVGKEEYSSLLSVPNKELWSKTLSRQGDKYATWARFPQIPMLN